HTRFSRDWSSDVCSSDLVFAIADNDRVQVAAEPERHIVPTDGGQRVGEILRVDAELDDLVGRSALARDDVTRFSAAGPGDDLDRARKRGGEGKRSCAGVG